MIKSSGWDVTFKSSNYSSLKGLLYAVEVFGRRVRRKEGKRRTWKKEVM
jgi:hypothetical protein